MIYKNGVFCLIVAQDVPEEKEFDPVGVLGIDLGIENIAVDSDREIFENKKTEHVRKRYSRPIRQYRDQISKEKIKEIIW